MSLHKEVVKFKDIDLVGEYYNPEWEGALNGPDFSPEAQIVKLHRKDIIRYGSIGDNGADYDYDDYSLIQIKGQGWFLLNTSGCSCPSPDETWVVMLYAKTLPELKKEFDVYASGESYGTVMNQLSEFQELFDFAKEQTKVKRKTYAKLEKKY